MNPSERAELERLRVEVRELREELAEYRGRDGADAADEEDRARRDFWRQAFRRAGVPGTAGRMMQIRLLLILMGRPGRIVSKATLIEMLGSDADIKCLDVYLYGIRRGLRKLGIANPIETVWGMGLRMAQADAERLLAYEAEHTERRAA